MPLILCLLLALPSPFALAVTLLAAEVPPYVIRAQQGAPTGMAVEVVEEAARRLREPLTIELMPFARALVEAQHRSGVLLLPPVRSQDRETRLQWIAPLLEESFVLASDRRHRGEPLTLAEARRLKIGVLRHSLSHSLLQARGMPELESVGAERGNADKLARGRIQAWAAAWNTMRYAQQEAGLPLTRLIKGETLARVPLYLAANLDFPAEEAARWRHTLAEMAADGSLDRILLQYDYQAP
ncbi:substrate-binding periplasmic protein [Aeromonas bivalvium]|uniref:substrate-binding periplasmic protein n=1 Tax=Aeromonas bivalvium TaxID=440079 RepID=UPI0038CFA38E